MFGALTATLLACIISSPRDPCCEVLVYKLNSVNGPAPIEIGEALYEKGGARFLYRICFSATKDASIAVGFDGDEYWMAILEPPPRNARKRERRLATHIARYDSWKSLSTEFPRDLRNTFLGHSNGMALMLQVAVLEDLARIIGVRDGSQLTGGALRAASTKRGNVTVYDPSVSDSPPGKRHLDPDLAYFAVSATNLGKMHVWDYFVEVDPANDDAIVSICASVTSRRIWISGFSPGPRGPFPPSFEIRPANSSRVSTAKFSPQFYSGAETRVQSYVDGKVDATSTSAAKPLSSALSEEEFKVLKRSGLIDMERKSPLIRLRYCELSMKHLKQEL